MFDSCYSASGTRSKLEDDNSLTLVRSVQLKDVPFRKETDHEIRESLTRSGRPDRTHSRRSFGSHMLISACNSSEDAREYNGHGKLSTALLKLLDKTSPNKLRYCDILANIEPISLSVCFCHCYKTFALNDFVPLFLDRTLNVKVTSKIDCYLMAKFSSPGRITPSDLTRTPRSLPWEPALPMEY